MKTTVHARDLEPRDVVGGVFVVSTVEATVPPPSWDSACVRVSGHLTRCGFPTSISMPSYHTLEVERDPRVGETVVVPRTVFEDWFGTFEDVARVWAVHPDTGELEVVRGDGVRGRIAISEARRP